MCHQEKQHTEEMKQRNRENTGKGNFHFLTQSSVKNNQDIAEGKKAKYEACCVQQRSSFA